MSSEKKRKVKSYSKKNTIENKKILGKKGNAKSKLIEKSFNTLKGKKLKPELPNSEFQKKNNHLENVQNKYYCFFQNSPSAYLILNSKYIILENNHAALELLNDGKKSLVRNSFLPYIVTEFKKIFLFYAEKLNSSNKKEQFEIKIKPENSNPIWVLIECSIETEFKKKETINLAIKDISIRKKTEFELKEREMELESILNNSNDLILRFNKEYRILIVGPVIEKMIGVSSEKTTGRTISEIGFPEETLKIWRQHCDSVFKTGEPDDLDISLDQSGGIKHFHTTLVPEFGSDGLVATILAIVRDITTRKKREDELHRTRDYLENLFNYANAPIITWNINLEITRFNYAFAKMTGYEATEVLGKKLSILFPENSREESLRKIKKTLNEKWEVVEIPILCKDGEIRIVLWNSANVYDKEGKNLEATIAQGQDITERINMEKALEASKDQLLKAHALLESVTLGTKVLIAAVDKEYRYTFYNQEHHNELQLLTRKDTSLGMSLMEVLSDMPEQLEKALNLWKRALEGETVVQTLEFGDPGRYKRWYNTRHTPIYNLDGNIIGAGEVTSDITEFMNMQEALRESETKFRTMVETANEGIITISPDGKFLYVNQRMADMLGYHVDELIGRPSFNFIVGEYHNNIKEARKTLHEGESFSGEIKFKRKDGKTFWSMYNSSPIFNDKGEHIANLAMHTDITKRKEVEEDLRKLNEELEERVRRRTEEAVNERKRFFDVLETLPVMICLLTPDYHTIFANRSFREKFGESKGRFCYEYCYGKNEPCSFCESFNVFKTGKPHHWEVNTPDGYVISAYDYPFTDIDGSPLILEMDIDITETRRNESELKKYRENLERLVEDRAAEIIAINEELTRFNNAAVGRELRMIELKKEVNGLCIGLNQKPPYPLEFEEEKK